jgi:hypothetical protein
MNYATWKLNFSNSDYGTGPEDKISELGFDAQASWVSGKAEEGGIILGYVSQEQDETELTDWEFQNISQAEALAFCIALNPEAFILGDGTIAAPIEEAGI